MATYTETGVAVAGASYPVKAGAGTSARTAAGPDALTFTDTGAATSTRTATALDAATSVETGAASSAFVGSGSRAVVGTTNTKAGIAVAGGVFPVGGSTYTKAGIAISGESFSYRKAGAAITARVASGAKVGNFTYTKTGAGVSARVGSGAKISSTGKSGGNMQPPYGSFVYGDEDYGEDTYGGFRNDARRIGSGTVVVTSPPTIFTGGVTSVRTASALEATTHGETGTGESEREATGTSALIYAKTGGSMEPPYGSVVYGDGEYGDDYYGGFRNDGRRIGSGFANKELERAGTGIMDASGGGFFIPAVASGDVEITDDDDIMLAIDELLSGDVVLTVTES